MVLVPKTVRLSKCSDRASIVSYMISAADKQMITSTSSPSTEAGVSSAPATPFSPISWATGSQPQSPTGSMDQIDQSLQQAFDSRLKPGADTCDLDVDVPAGQPDFEDDAAPKPPAGVEMPPAAKAFEAKLADMIKGIITEENGGVRPSV